MYWHCDVSTIYFCKDIVTSSRPCMPVAKILQNILNLCEPHFRRLRHKFFKIFFDAHGGSKKLIRAHFRESIMTELLTKDKKWINYKIKNPPGLGEGF